MNIAGIFWKADDPSETIAGNLVIEPDGEYRLDLEGSFGRFGQFFASEPYLFVHGATRDGDYTLYNCVPTGGNLRTNGYPRQTLWVENVIKGALISELESFDEFFLELDHLQDWHRMTGIELLDNPTGDARWTASYAWPPRVAATLAGGETVELVFNHHRRAPAGRLEVEEHSLLKVTVAQPSSVRYLFTQYGAKLRDLITILTLTPEVITKVVVTGPEFAIRRAEGSDIRRDLEVLGRFVQPAANLRASRALHPIHQLATLADWPGGFHALISGWFQLYDRLNEAIVIYTGLAYQPPYWFMSRIATLAQALEAYHRLSGLEVEDPSDWVNFANRVLDSYEGEERRWLEEKLRYAHEPTLASRLKVLVSRTREVLTPLFDNSRKRGRFIRDLTDARNENAHPGDRDRPLATIDVDQHYTLFLEARWLFLANVLLDLGLDQGTARQLVSRNAEFDQLAARITAADEARRTQGPQSSETPTET